MVPEKPPKSTQSQYTKQRELRRQFWTAQRRAEKVNPSEREMEIVRRAAVSMTAFDPEWGRKSAWPSAMDIVEYHHGYDLPGRGKTPLSASEVPSEESYRHVELLRLVMSLNREIEDDVESGATEAVTVTCPVCDSETITSHVGTLPAWDREDDTLYPQNDPRMVALSLDCHCTELSPDHYDDVEQEAKENYGG